MEKEENLFIKYGSIENSYRDKFIQKIRDKKLEDQEWVVQEKVHGANISFISTDGSTFVTASRNRIVPESGFHGHVKIRKLLEPSLVAIWKEI